MVLLEKRVVFIDLPLMITMLLYLSSLKVKAAHFRAIVQLESKAFAPHIVEDIALRVITTMALWQFMHLLT